MKNSALRSGMISALLVTLSFTTFAAAKKPAWDDAGKGGVWRFRGFASGVFTCNLGVQVYSNAIFNVDFRVVNRNGWIPDGEIFKGRGFDWSFIAVAEPEIPADGRYVFRLANGLEPSGKAKQWNSGALRLGVNGTFSGDETHGRSYLLSGERGEVALDLKKGRARLEVWGRHAMENNWMGQTFFVEWKKPGDADFSLFRPEPCSDAALRECGPKFDHEFKFDDGFNRISGYRSWKFSVPEDGLYAFTYHSGEGPYTLRMRVDRAPIINWLPTCSNNVMRALRGGFAALNDPQRHYPADFFGRFVVKKHLTKGEHLFDIMTDDRGGVPALENRLRNNLRLGVTRLTGRHLVRDVAFFPEGRETMVLAKGETMDVFGFNAGPKAPYTMEVRRTRGQEAIWTQTLEVGNKQTKFSFQPTEEGGYEYAFKDKDGLLVDGPWNFCMCDPTPVKVPKMTTDTDLSVQGEVVDTIDCREGAGAEHDFREFGKSELVTVNGVTSRLTPPNPPATVIRWQDRSTWTWPVVTPDQPAKGMTRRSCRIEWFAYTIHPKHPGRTHILRIHVPNDLPRMASVMAIDPTTQESCGVAYITGQGPAASGASACTDLVVWPNSKDLYLVAFHTGNYHGSTINRRGAITRYELIELPDDLPLLPEPVAGWNQNRRFGWTGEQGDLWVNERTMPPLFPDRPGYMAPAGAGHLYRRWDDFLITFERFMRFSAWRGDNELSVPVLSYGMLYADGEELYETGRGGDAYRDGPLATHCDRFHRDVFRIMLMKAQKYGVKIYADFSRTPDVGEIACWAANQGRPAETNQVLLSRTPDNKIWRFYGPSIMNPAHDVGRAQMVDFCGRFAKRYGAYSSFGGIRLRFWDGCTAGFEPYFYDAGLGYDDYTVAKFEKDTGIKLGMVGSDPKKWQARKNRLTGRELREKWWTWRSETVKSCLTEMLAAMRKYAPQADFLGPQTPPADWVEPTAEEIDFAANTLRRPLPHYLWQKTHGLDVRTFRGHPELGYREGFFKIHYPGSEICGMDSYCMDAVDRRPAPYTNLPPIKVRSQFPSFCCNGAYRVSPYQLEGAAKLLAKNGLSRLWTTPEWSMPPGDESLRHFVQRFRTIPDLDYKRTELPGGEDANVATWSAKDTDGNLVVWMVNATEYAQEVEVQLASRVWRIVNQVDGETLHARKSFTRELPPFMLEVWKVEGENSVAGASLEVSDAEKEYVKGLYRDILEMEPFAKDAIERVSCIEGFANNEPQHPFMTDRAYTYAQLVDPMKAAYEDGDYVTLGVLVRRFNRERTWWYEAFGWPEGMKCDRPVGGMFDISHAYHYRRPGTLFETNNVKLVKMMYNAERYATTEPGQPLVLKRCLRSSTFRLEICALFGGEYGDLKVLTNGVYCGTFRAGPGKTTRDQSRTLPIRVVRKLWEGEGDLAFVPEPGKRVAIRRVEQIMEDFEPVPAFKVAVANGKEPNDPTLVWKEIQLNGCRNFDLAPLVGDDTKSVESRTVYVRFTAKTPRGLATQCFRTGRSATQCSTAAAPKFSTEDKHWQRPSHHWRGASSDRIAYRGSQTMTYTIKVRPLEPEGPYTFGVGFLAGGDLVFGW